MFGQSLRNFYIDVPAAPAQAVKTRLLLWLGEWYLDTNEGTPYLQGVLGKHTQTMADTTIQDRVSSTPGVTSFQNFSSSFDSERRSYSARLTLNTVYGLTEVELMNFVNF